MDAKRKALGDGKAFKRSGSGEGDALRAGVIAFISVAPPLQERLSSS